MKKPWSHHTQIAEFSGCIPVLALISGLNAGVGAYVPVMTKDVRALLGRDGGHVAMPRREKTP